MFFISLTRYSLIPSLVWLITPSKLQNDKFSKPSLKISKYTILGENSYYKWQLSLIAKIRLEIYCI